MISNKLNPFNISLTLSTVSSNKSFLALTMVICTSSTIHASNAALLNCRNTSRVQTIDYKMYTVMFQFIACLRLKIILNIQVITYILQKKIFCLLVVISTDVAYLLQHVVFSMSLKYYTLCVEGNKSKVTRMQGVLKHLPRMWGLNALHNKLYGLLSGLNHWETNRTNETTDCDQFSGSNFTVKENN